MPSGDGDGIEGCWPHLGEGDLCAEEASPKCLPEPRAPSIRDFCPVVCEEEMDMGSWVQSSVLEEILGLRQGM